MRGTSRRIGPGATAPGRGAIPPRPLTTRRVPLAESGPPGVAYALSRFPYQNNGATPWAAQIPMGTPGQTLKIALDTGCNFIWATSTLCGSGCVHYGNVQFDPSTSSTFEMINPTPQEIGFGPWGNMTVELGSDYFSLAGQGSVHSPFFLSSAYSGAQFQQLDWDGGIGLPSGDLYADEHIPNIVNVLMNRGLIDPASPFLSFVTDQASGTGKAWLGGYDPNAYDPSSGIFMPFAPYAPYPSVDYIWTTPMAAWQVGGQTLATNGSFCLDSGSSCFKGDPNVMQQTFNIASGPNPPDVTITAGNTADGAPGMIVVPPSIYTVKIQAGPDEGKILPQFSPLAPLDGLFLVGSVLMDYIYTIYEYRVVVLSPSSQYWLQPYGMWAFNKVGGPQIIKSRSSKPPALGRKAWIQIA